MSIRRPETRGNRSRWRRFAGLASRLGAVAMVIALTGPAPACADPPARTSVDPERLRLAFKQHVLRTLDGGSLSLATLRGEVVVVNFWATWCAPCRRELADLDALHAEISRQGGRVLAVSIDHEARNVRDFARKHRLTLPIYHDGPEGLAHALDLQHIPFTLVLDRDGEVAFTTVGTDGKALEALGAVTRQLLARKPVATRPTEGDTP